MSFHDILARWSEWGWPLIANHLWQATLVFLLALAAARLLNRATARARYTIWLIASLKFVVPSILIVFLMNQAGIKFPSLFDRAAPPGSVTVIYKVAEPVFQVEESPITSAELVRSHNEIYCAMTAVWFTGSAAFFVMWWRRRRQFSIAIRAGKVMSAGREFETLARVREWLAVRRPVKLALTPKLIEPGVWRVWRPVVVLPREMPDHLTDGELEAVMMHEMIHIARHDNLTNSIQMFFCCLLWFHPVVWLIDRKLLAEREQACDEQVIEMSGASKVYASSLLKVFRFCLGSKVAGVSYATGSNLRRRIEQIMAENTDRKFTLSHRMLIAAIAVIVLVFSLAAGLFSRASFAAQKSGNNIIESGGPVSGVPGGVPGGVSGGIPGGVPGGVPGGIPGGVEDNQRDQLPPPPLPPMRKLPNSVLESLEQATEIAAQFINRDNTPLTITSVRVKSAKVSAFSTDEKVTESYQVIKPLITMVNSTGRRIAGFKMRIRNKGAKFHIVTYRSRLQIEPGETFTLGESADDTIFYTNGSAHLESLSAHLESLTAEITGVIFEDKGLWGDYPAPPRGESSDVLVVPLEPPNRGEPQKDPPPSSSDALEGSKIVRKSGGVLMNSATRRAEPTYPMLAKAANVSGAVTVEITINEQGVVTSARAVSGHPLLLDAAVTAARQWEFLPTTLSGEPVRVTGTITFNFTL
ncbi:MAG TPA: M56 family metallopeptidase [Blastocatellia bacterium]|nr:M56 family metallopeptidase [Blastocatellia bacterium]